MASIINANTSGGLISTGDTSGQLQLQTVGTTALTVTSGQLVGIGTSSPSSILDVSSASTVLRLTSTTGTNSVYQRLSNTGGQLYFGIDNSAGNDLATGSTAYAGVLVAPGTTRNLHLGTNGTVQATIDSSGTFFVGTTTTSYFGAGAKTNINGGGTCALVTTTSGGAGYAAQYVHNTATTTNNAFISFGTEGTWTERGSITYNRAGGLTVYNTTSDYRSKTVNGLVQNALSKVALLKPSTGRMNDAEYDIDFFVAHELQEVVPSAVTGEKDAVNEDSTPKYQMVDKSALIPLLTAAIQELSTQVTELKAEVQSLKGA